MQLRAKTLKESSFAGRRKKISKLTSQDQFETVR